MAHLVLGIGSSHGPTIQSPPEVWRRLGDGDAHDSRYDFAALLRDAPPGLDEEITLERQTARHEANQAGLAALSDRLRAAGLDAIVVVSNPHRVWPEDNQPVFGVFRGSQLPVGQRRGARDPETRFQRGGERQAPEIKLFPGEPDLANHLIETLIEDGFDIAATDQMREGVALDEAFTFLYQRFLPEGGVPMVPFILSRYLPHQATAARCYALGQALRRSIESWDSDSRVGIMASGGLSHQIIDQELDHTVIDALVGGDVKTLCGLDRGRLNGAPGTPEILNWVAVAGAMEPTLMTLVGYEPCYRSLAGTGHGVTFGYWQQGTALHPLASADRR